jgi:hypothetical protein
MIPLTELEADILGDLAWDSHLVGEIIGFVRSANPLEDDFGVYRLTYSLLLIFYIRKGMVHQRLHR